LTVTRIDARGMRCPWPVVRLARAVREGASAVLILADDPIAPGEIAALAQARGWGIAPADEPHGWVVSTVEA
jgi:tRNA 2-thiouridine synthesizing protein A